MSSWSGPQQQAAPAIDSSLAKIREYFESEGEEGAEKVSIWTPRVSLAVERNSRGINVSIKVRSDEPEEAVRILDWLNEKLAHRYPPKPDAS